jgi:predicted dehydrogenase
MATPRIGIIGIGNMGQIHARVLGNMRALTAVADSDFEKAKKIGAIYNVKAFDSFESMIQDSALDGIIISTPTSTHAAIAEKIARDYGSIKGLLIEKPLASTIEDANHVASLLRSKGIATVVSHSEVYNPVVDRALALIQSGAIGNPRNVIHDRRGFVQPSRIPSLGDVFEDIGVHDFDIMARISAGRAKLYAQCNSDGGVFNSATIIIKFENGTEHAFHLSRQYAGRRRYMDVSGTKGTLVLDLFAQIITVQDLDQAPSSDSRTLQLPERGLTIKVYGEPVQEVIYDFLKCMETKAAPKVGLEDGVAALRIVEAARASAKSGKVVDVSVQAKGSAVR